jgi:hypothetical protein
MSLTLHPPGFVETGGCNGPRYVRSQPSRETAGILLNECEAKYETQFELPYRNINRYVKEMQMNWDRLTDNEKSVVVQDFVKNVPSVATMIVPPPQSDIKSSRKKKENFEEGGVLSIIKDIETSDGGDINKNTKQLLDGLYNPDDTIKSSVSESVRDDIRIAFNQWADDQNLYFHTNYKTGIFLFLLIVLFFLFGLGIMQCSSSMQRRR